MINRFSVAPLSAMTSMLAAVAMGRQPPDYIITGARVLSTYTERLLENQELWIKGGRIAAVKQAGSYPLLPGDYTVRYDVGGGIIAPGLVDAQVEIESNMMSACAYAETALLNGTTTIFCDCGGIASVCGERGINWLLSDARRAPLSIYAKVPVMAPGAVQTMGGDLTKEKITQVFADWPEAVALGGLIDFAQLAKGEPHDHAILAVVLSKGRLVSGRIYGSDFIAASAAAGMTDAHGADDVGTAVECLEAGAWLFLRDGLADSSFANLTQTVKALAKRGVSTKRICVCTGDRDAHDRMSFGLDSVVRQVVAAGVNPVAAWSMGSLHPATRYGMDGEIGGLGHARRADLVLLNDELEVQNTWYGGQLVVENKKITSILDKALSKRYEYPQVAYKTVRLPRHLKLTPELPPASMTANIIGVVPSGIVLEHRQIVLDPACNWDELLVKHGLCFAAVAERHGKTGGVAHGLLQGFGLSNGAVASSVAHDAHNVIVVGSNEADMKLALATVKATNGGVCAVRGGRVLSHVALPVVGLMSDQRAPDVARQTKALKLAWAELGCTLPFIRFSRLASCAFPEIRLTDRGLVLVPAMHLVPLFTPRSGVIA